MHARRLVLCRQDHCTHVHTNILSLPPCPRPSLSLSLTHTHTVCVSLCLCLCLSTPPSPTLSSNTHTQAQKHRPLRADVVGPKPSEYTSCVGPLVSLGRTCIVLSIVVEMQQTAARQSPRCTHLRACVVSCVRSSRCTHLIACDVIHECARS